MRPWVRSERPRLIFGGDLRLFGCMKKSRRSPAKDAVALRYS
jgi:hypothetical protein